MPAELLTSFTGGKDHTKVVARSGDVVAARITKRYLWLIFLSIVHHHLPD